MDKAFHKLNVNYKLLCHISHSYHQGASLYFTFLYPLEQSDPVKQWWTIKETACEALVKGGGTLSHHHGIGRDHSQWLGKELGQSGIHLLGDIKNSFDPNGILNKGCLIP